MNLLYEILFFLLGIFAGKFFHKVGEAIPKKERILSSHDVCANCGHTLKWYEGIPLFSYILSRGTCHYCKGKIDILSTYISFFTGILFVVAFYSFSFSYELLVALGIVSLLMIIVVSDLNYLIIPDEVLITFSIYFILISLIFTGLSNTFHHLLYGIFLFGIMYLVMMIGKKKKKKETLGGGDIKMMFLFGFLLDPFLGILSVFIGSLFALPISLFLLWKQKEPVIPFGPFLLIALTFLFFTKLTTHDVLTFLQFR